MTGLEQAEQLAVSALGFLAEDADRLNAFLMQTGLAPENLRDAAQNEDFLEAVMDFIGSSDEMVLAFCQTAACRPEDFQRAAQIIAHVKLPT